MANRIIVDVDSTVGERETQEKTNFEEARQEPSFSDRESYKYNPNYHRFADFLGLKGNDKMDFDIAQKVAFLRDFTGEEDEVEAMLKIKEMKKKLGVSYEGRELVNTLYKYARLLKERERIEKEISLLQVE